MASFRTEMIAKPPPKTIKELINSLIPPKGIKRGKNIAETELPDGKEMVNDVSEEEDDENDFDAKQLFAALSGNFQSKPHPKSQSKKANLLLVRLCLLLG